MRTSLFYFLLVLVFSSGTVSGKPKLCGSVESLIDPESVTNSGITPEISYHLNGRLVMAKIVCDDLTRPEGTFEIELNKVPLGDQGLNEAYAICNLTNWLVISTDGNIVKIKSIGCYARH
ncbi:hypothetical protein CAEBREN_01990 [Caenorhabditis brenneri]|uniref:C6 domain-containing protein n=1 Tax=Caenorhabditis brenneri TaxID=135651 RepID=G0NNB6_CAEBE|nr:hypothetical protein CAEBREN_01990 [Caenorhabditis brenneri]